MEQRESRSRGGKNKTEKGEGKVAGTGVMRRKEGGGNNEDKPLSR